MSLSVLPRDRSLVATKHPRLGPGVLQQRSQLLIKLIISQNIQKSLHQNTVDSTSAQSIEDIQTEH